MPILSPRDTLGIYYDAIIPPSESGYLHLALGLNGYFTDAGEYTFKPDKLHPDAKWIQRVFRYPDERGDAFDWILDMAHKGDVYGCPNLLTGHRRKERTAVSPQVIHGDVDTGQLDYIAVQDLGGFVVASGSPGHGQILIPLSAAVTEEQRRALCIAVRERFDGDDKIADNDVLRLPYTFNYKGRARGGAATEVRLVEPLPATRVKPHELAAEFKLDLSNICLNGHRPDAGADKQAPDAAEAPEPVDMSDYPWIQDSLDDVTDAGDGGRSVDISRVVKDCFDAGLTLPQTRWVVNRRADLVAKLAELTHDDVARNWNKTAKEWPHPQYRAKVTIDAIVADWQAKTNPPEPTTWEPVELGPWLDGTIELPKPTLGMARTDGQRLIYAGREHSILGETESGKTWLALGCVAAELFAGNTVVYIHYEEGDPASTIERLRLLGVDRPTIDKLLRFVAPDRPPKAEWITALCDPPPTLVVHDGVNEAMTLMGAEVKDVDGAAAFRRRLVTPFRKAGAATIACDHMPLNAAPGRVEAFGSVHKGNALDGARIMLINEAPFGRNMRGASHVFVTKDRPGHLRNNGKPTKTPGKTYMGTLVVDNENAFMPMEMVFYAPKTDGSSSVPTVVSSAELADMVYDVIVKLPDHTVESARMLFARMREAGQSFRDGSIRQVVDDLIVAGRLTELPGKRGANKYQAVVTAARTASNCGPEVKQ